MEIYQGLNNLDTYKNIVIALGNFDGVHMGHRELICRTVEISQKREGTAAVFTFDPHPLKVLQPDSYPQMLLTKEDKIRIMSELGIQLLIIFPFLDFISKLTPRQFVKEILVDKLKVKLVVVGYNYNFGFKGEGNAESLQELAAEYGIEAIIVPPVKRGLVEVSSTLIRNLLLDGNVSDAAEYLGYYPFVESYVVAGDQRGTKIGFPTANINLSEEVITPANGVYAVRVYINGQKLNGIANIGIKPTFDLDQPKNLEVHVFDFCEDIYHTRIRVEFIGRIRGEQQFSSVSELIIQIAEDVTEAKKMLF